MKNIYRIIVFAIAVTFVSCDKDSNDAPEPQQIFGCTDVNATNYNADATASDGSCEYSISYYLNGEWNITNLEYETEFDLSAVNELLGVQTIEGESADAGTITINENDQSYLSSLSFTTEPLSVLTFEVPGIPVDLPSQGDWFLSEDESVLTLVDDQTSANQIYEIINLTESFMLLRGSVIYTQEIPMLGDFDFEIELELTLGK